MTRTRQAFMVLILSAALSFTAGCEGSLVVGEGDATVVADGTVGTDAGPLGTDAATGTDALPPPPTDMGPPVPTDAGPPPADGGQPGLAGTYQLTDRICSGNSIGLPAGVQFSFLIFTGTTIERSQADADCTENITGTFMNPPPDTFDASFTDRSCSTDGCFVGGGGACATGVIDPPYTLYGTYAVVGTYLDVTTTSNGGDCPAGNTLVYHYLSL